MSVKIGPDNFCGIWGKNTLLLDLMTSEIKYIPASNETLFHRFSKIFP
ncbi:hypothetical protein MmTuc01_3110 [Methanosarcina mazei Tuc01]|nr:hypothetical protein MmTuc01_3110 [Methanosarcina mazei Tuc01]